MSDPFASIPPVTQPDPTVGPISSTPPSVPALPPSALATSSAAPTDKGWDPFGAIGDLVHTLFRDRTPEESAAFLKTTTTPAIGNFTSPLDAAKQIGGAVVGAVGSPVIVPFQAAANVAQRIPTAWIPGPHGSADDQFNALGAAMKAQDPQAYVEWAQTNDAANKDVLNGGQQKVEFTRKWGLIYNDRLKQQPDYGIFKNNPGLAFSSPGSVGQALGDALGLLGLAGQDVQAGLGERSVGVTNKVLPGGNFTGDRIDQIVERGNRGLELNPIEQTIVNNLTSGAWDKDHALAYLVREGQGLSRDTATQLVGSLATDPTAYLMGGSGAVLKAVRAGEAISETAAAARAAQTGETLAEARAALTPLSAARALEAAGVPVSNAQKAAMAVAEVSHNPIVAPVAKVARSILDPFHLLGHDTPTQGMVDMLNATSVNAVRRIYGPDAYSAVFRLAREAGVTTEMQAALGGYSSNLGRTWALFEHAASQVGIHGGEHIFSAENLDGIIGDLMQAGARDAETRLTDYGYSLRKLFTTAEDDAQLNSRLRDIFPNANWDVSTMSQEVKSLLHAVTYQGTNASLMELRAATGAIRIGERTTNDLVAMNDNVLDNYAAQEVLRDVRAASQAVDDGTGTLDAWYKVWRTAHGKYADIADLGLPKRSKVALEELNTRLDNLINSGRLHERMPLTALESDPALKPYAEWIKSHLDENGDPLWNLGFRPDEMHAFGFRRSDLTGELIMGRQPFASHVQSGTMAERPVSDVVANFLGQLIKPLGETRAKGVAATLARPVEAVEVGFRTAADVVSGQRILANMEQRFIVNMAKHDVTARDAVKLFRGAKDAAGLMHTTLQGVDQKNVWHEVEGLIKENGLRDRVTKRVMMSELLDAAGGDMRIMGVTSGLSQRTRNLIEGSFGSDLLGRSNYTGALTVNAYRAMRYALNPLFYAQRVTDAIYFAILTGVPPLGGGEMPAILREARQISERIAETSFVRDTAFDIPEFNLMSTMQTKLGQRVEGLLPSGPFSKLATFGDTLQLNNMWSHTMSQFGNIVKESLDEGRAILTKKLLDPSLSEADRALTTEALDRLDVFPSLRLMYSKQAGRYLSDDEVGLRYLQDQWRASQGQTVSEEGWLQWRHDITEGTYQNTGKVGELQPIRQDYIAQDLFGYSVQEMHDAIATGETSIADIAERLGTEMGADPAFIKRATDAIQFNWGDFWSAARAKWDLSPRESEALQGIIGREAQTRGMNPVEYLSQALPLSTGKAGVNDHVGQLLRIIRAGSTGDEATQVRDLASIWMSTLNPSARRTLLGVYRRDLPEQIAAARAAGDATRAAELSTIQQRLEGRIASPTGEAAVEAGVAQDAATYTDKYPDRTVVLALDRYDAAGNTVKGEVTIQKSLGDGLLAAPPEQRDMLLAHVDALRHQFPDVALVHMDIRADMHTPLAEGGLGAHADIQASTVNFENGEPAFFFSPKWFGPDAKTYWEQHAAREKGLADLAAKTGRRYLQSEASEGPLGVIYHEFMHAIDTLLRPEFGEPLAKDAAYIDLLNRLADDNLPVQLSRYASRDFMQETLGREWVAELGDLAFNPSVDRATLPEAIHNAVEDLRNTLGQLGYFHPPATPDLSLMDAGSHAALADDFAHQVIKRAGIARPHVNPDVEGVTQDFAKWLRGTAQDEFLMNRSKIGAVTKNIMAKVPTDAAFHYNRSEALVQQLIAQKMKLAQRNSFRLAEMSTQRTVASRTLNHPVFGMYPTSYMWGKVLPETIKFLAKEPFGFESGVAGYTLEKVQQAIAAQREYDPNFDAHMGTLDKSATGFLLDYITPGLPWSDFRAAAPQWYLEALKEKQNLDLFKITAAQFATMDPTRWWAHLKSSVSEIDKAAHAPGGPLAAPGAPTPAQSLAPVIGQPTAAPTQTAPQAVPQAPTGPAAQLAQPLGDAMKQLTGLFSGQ